jgi:hypothetical protein
MPLPKATTAAKRRKRVKPPPKADSESSEDEKMQQPPAKRRKPSKKKKKARKKRRKKVPAKPWSGKMLQLPNIRAKKPPGTEGKPGMPSFRDIAKLPKGAGHRTRVQHNLNLAKEASTMSKYRTGFMTMWRTVPRHMQRAKVLPPGSYDRYNHHGGTMFGWPDECTLTDFRVSKILFACINSGKLTHSQLETVRKTLSYAWELHGKKTKDSGNWPCVATLLESVRAGQVKPNRRGTGAKARFIPTPEQLRHAIEQGWTPEHPWPLFKWCTHYLCFWDTMVCGARSKVDTGKVKTSKDHAVSCEQGWQRTGFDGGRSKLTGPKKGTRPWSMWRISEGKIDQNTNSKSQTPVWGSAPPNKCHGTRHV